MKLIMIFLTSIVLTGCYYQTTTIRDIENAAKICGGLDQVAEILVAFDGARERISQAALRGEVKP